MQISIYFLLGNYVLTYLYNQPKLTQFVVQGLVTLFARITKLGWFDSKEEEFVFRDVIQDVTKFLQVLNKLNQMQNKKIPCLIVMVVSLKNLNKCSF